MAALITKDLDKKIRSAIDNRRMVSEIRGRIDEATELSAGNDAVKIAIESGMNPCHDIERTKASGLVPLVWRNALSDDPHEVLDAIYPWDLA